MTEEARKTAKAMHQNECEDCVFNPTNLGCRWRKKGMYCDTALHSAADLIESLSEQLEQVTKERDAAVEDLEAHRPCDACGYYELQGYDCMNCRRYTDRPMWRWRGLQEE